MLWLRSGDVVYNGKCERAKKKVAKGRVACQELTEDLNIIERTCEMLRNVIQMKRVEKDLTGCGL